MDPSPVATLQGQDDVVLLNSPVANKIRNVTNQKCDNVHGDNRRTHGSSCENCDKNPD